MAILYTLTVLNSFSIKSNLDSIAVKNVLATICPIINKSSLYCVVSESNPKIIVFGVYFIGRTFDGVHSSFLGNHKSIIQQQLNNFKPLFRN